MKSNLETVSALVAGSLAALILVAATPAQAGTEMPIFSFPGANAGGQPTMNAQPVLNAKGRLFGTAGFGRSGTAELGSVFALSPPAPGASVWTRALIYSFKGGVPGSTDGYGPDDGLTLGKGGVLYGFAAFSGPSNSGGCGLAYQLTPPASGQTGFTYSVIYRFQATDPNDGCRPINEAPLIGADGSIYGTTELGGDANDNGTLFRLHPPINGQTPRTETVLKRFGSAGPSAFGANPMGSVVANSAGDLFGTASAGGQNGLGTAWERLANGTFIKLHDFAGGSDGASPAAGLIGPLPGPLLSRTYYYGTTQSGGGASGCAGGCGTVFALVMAGTSITEGPIHAFAGGTDGASPEAGLFYNGALWGTTFSGGTGPCLSGCGTIFSVAFTKFGGYDYSLGYSFGSGTADGFAPQTGLTGNVSGALFGMTQFGGGRPNGAGTVFEFQP